MSEWDSLRLCSAAFRHKWRAAGSWRRFSTSVFLVTALFFVTLIFIQRIATFSSFYLTIGKTMQSWSTSEVDIANLTTEIDEALAEQRALIAQEMKGYTYPAGKYNISAKSLKDLVPELGGQPVRSLVLTTWRSGSTFLGDVLNSHPATFYHYELDYEIVQIRGPPMVTDAINRVSNLLRCDFINLEHYLQHGQEHTWLFTHNTRLWDRCLLHPNICWLPQLLSPLCSLFPFQILKTVRLRLRLIEEFLADSRLNVRVVFLVRDPRGTMQSRSILPWCRNHADCDSAELLCADLVDDYSAALRFTIEFPNKFKVVRYEDMSLKPEVVFPDIFKFFGLHYHSSVKEFVRNHTTQNQNNIYSTYRDSSNTALLWRQKSNYSKVKNLQEICRVALSAWGYLPAHNASHQLVFNPLVEPFKLQ